MNKKNLSIGLLAVLLFYTVDALAVPHRQKAGHGTSGNHQAHAKAQKNTGHPFIVAIDAGHGGKDTGAIGPTGLMEKNVAYSISRHLVNMLDKDKSIKPVMVRHGDKFIGLQQRSAIARDAGADLLVSIHADAFRDDGVKGSSVFTLLNPKGRGGQSAATRKASHRAATKMLGELRNLQVLHCRQVKRARYAVLRTQGVPSMLIETGFITNPQEEMKLATLKHQEKIAQSIYNGVRAYARTAKPTAIKLSKFKHVMVASR
ncbi:MAG: N-acetylmuramoyl-L-alanine amidase family protein [Candidatus Methylumidiphilus sp.]